MVPLFLDMIVPMNESRPKNSLYHTQYNVDEDNYFYWIYGHGYISGAMCITIMVSVDTIIMITFQHACGMLKILG